MRWYYYGIGHKAKETRDKAKRLAEHHGCKFKIVRTKDPIGGFMYKVFFSKSI